MSSGKLSLFWYCPSRVEPSSTCCKESPFLSFVTLALSRYWHIVIMEQKLSGLMPRHRSYSLTLRRLPRSSAFRVLVLLFFLWESLHAISIYIHQQAASNAPPPPRNSKRIYIAAQHWNTAPILRSHWNSALEALVQELGIENVYVSIYESGSFDDTKDALRELDEALGALQVKKSIVLSDVSHADELAQQLTETGWIKTPAGETALRRIPFLSSVRNRVLEPLEALTAEGEHFDMILFLNDVVFTTEDVLRLLDTNGGDYAAACSLDFSKPPNFYDTFALRDSDGNEAIMQTWPYFRSQASRYAVERGLPVAVKSCWNGMGKSSPISTILHTKLTIPVAMPIAPFTSTPPLTFRGLPDSHASTPHEASECCLIHADNPLSHSKPILLNPLVRVGYNGSAYDAMHSPESILSPLEIFSSMWENRLRRLATPWWKEWDVQRRILKWMGEVGEVERGGFCVVDEMQVVLDNGWRHV
jgi:hypothetical protein